MSKKYKVLKISKEVDPSRTKQEADELAKVNAEAELVEIVLWFNKTDTSRRVR